MKKDKGITWKKRNKLVKRFEEYERWQKDEYDKGNVTIPKLPPESFPSPRELTVREIFALLQLLDTYGMDAVMEQVRDRQRKGFEDTSRGMHRWIDCVLDMSNEDIVDYLSGRKDFSRRTSIRHRLLSILESSLGPNGELGGNSRWNTWLDEEIKFWLLEGYIPPRIAYKIWPDSVGKPEKPLTETGWRRFMKDLNDSLNKVKKEEDIAHMEKYFPEGWEGIKEWLACCETQTSNSDAKQDISKLIGNKKQLDIRTIRAALELKGYRWKKSAYMYECGEWEKETVKSRRKTVVLVPKPKF